MATVQQTIIDAANRHGVDPRAMLAIAQIESNMDPRAQNPRSSAGGLFQFIDSTWDQYGGGNKYDPQRNADAAARFLADNQATLRRALGRDPSPGELYLAHQQGAGGALQLLSNPNAPATQIVGSEQVRLNGGNPNMTAGQFARLWDGKTSRALQSVGRPVPPANIPEVASQTSTAPQAPVPAPRPAQRTQQAPIPAPRPWQRTQEPPIPAPRPQRAPTPAPRPWQRTQQAPMPAPRPAQRTQQAPIPAPPPNRSGVPMPRSDPRQPGAATYSGSMANFPAQLSGGTGADSRFLQPSTNNLGGSIRYSDMRLPEGPPSIPGASPDMVSESHRRAQQARPTANTRTATQPGLAGTVRMPDEAFDRIGRNLPEIENPLVQSSVEPARNQSVAEALMTTPASRVDSDLGSMPSMFDMESFTGVGMGGPNPVYPPPGGFTGEQGSGVGPTPAPTSQSNNGLPSSAAPGTIMRGTDGKNYQYSETSGMLGASGNSGWIETSMSPSPPPLAPMQQVAPRIQVAPAQPVRQQPTGLARLFNIGGGQSLPSTYGQGQVSATRNTANTSQGRSRVGSRVGGYTVSSNDWFNDVRGIGGRDRQKSLSTYSGAHNNRPKGTVF